MSYIKEIGAFLVVKLVVLGVYSGCIIGRLINFVDSLIFRRK